MANGASARLGAELMTRQGGNEGGRVEEVKVAWSRRRRGHTPVSEITLTAVLNAAALEFCLPSSP